MSVLFFPLLLQSPVDEDGVYWRCDRQKQYLFCRLKEQIRPNLSRQTWPTKSRYDSDTTMMFRLRLWSWDRTRDGVPRHRSDSGHVELRLRLSKEFQRIIRCHWRSIIPMPSTTTSPELPTILSRSLEF